jgi:GTP-binding protein EngB required for normal cell division
MSASIQVIQCGNPDCKIAETGKCVEGLDPSACGNYGKPLRVLDDAPGAEEGAVPEMVSLPHADRLMSSEARDLLPQARARVIAIVGPHDSGKTSLIASLYDQLQDGPVVPFAFRGSQTLHAFEQACHDARAASQRGTPHSERTKRGEVRFFHLGLLHQEAGEELNLLLGDRAGEEYREACDDTTVATEFIEVERADVVTLLVDGRRLAQDSHRHNAREEMLLILQALNDSEIVPNGARLAVVLTKFDAVIASPNAKRVEADLTTVVARLSAHFADRFANIEVFRVAASPTEVGVERGTGVAELLSFWLADVSPPFLAQTSQGLPERVIARLAEVGV